jgi:hypothetical protein
MPRRSDGLPSVWKKLPGQLQCGRRVAADRPTRQQVRVYRYIIAGKSQDVSIGSTNQLNYEEAKNRGKETLVRGPHRMP